LQVRVLPDAPLFESAVLVFVLVSPIFAASHRETGPLEVPHKIPSYSHGQRMSRRILENVAMKNRSNGMDTELKQKIEGLTGSQVRLLASIYAGLADRLRNKTAAISLAKWKGRDDHSRN
jgi:hypothetical protein